jgi:hypothetical protein
MIAFFNAFQLNILLVCWPFIIGWLHTKPFEYSPALFWVSIIAFLVHFIFNLICVAEQFDRKR